jgi:hypothetical protein
MPLTAIHPGEHLAEELVALEMSASRASTTYALPSTRPESPSRFSQPSRTVSTCIVEAKASLPNQIHNSSQRNSHPVRAVHQVVGDLVERLVNQEHIQQQAAVRGCAGNKRKVAGHLEVSF